MAIKKGIFGIGTLGDAVAILLSIIIYCLLVYSVDLYYI